MDVIRRAHARYAQEQKLTIGKRKDEQKKIKLRRGKVRNTYESVHKREAGTRHKVYVRCKSGVEDARNGTRGSSVKK